MALKNFILFFSFFTIGTTYSQQNCEKVLLQGKVIDTLSPQYFYNFMIVNRTIGKGVFGQPNGSFSLFVNNRDSINLSIKGYPIIGFRVIADSNCQFNVKEYIERTATNIQEVVIHPLKSLEQIKEERSSLAMRETRMVTGIEALQSPITALYQAFSKKEQNKRWIAEQEFKDNQRQVVKELLRLYVSYDIISLTEEQFDEFISFLNIDIDFFKTATEMELVTFVKDKYEHFKIMNAMQIEQNTEWRKLLGSDFKGAVRELLNMYVANKAIDLPISEFERFQIYMNLQETFLKNNTDLDVYNFVRDNYYNYIDFYKIDIRSLKVNYNITEKDNEDWKWDLAHKKDKKAATIILIKLYNEHNVIQIPEEEFDRFYIFLNLKESFMKTAKNEELISYVRDKYYKYLDFYTKEK
jgi:hypothetical protein